MIQHCLRKKQIETQKYSQAPILTNLNQVILKILFKDMKSKTAKLIISLLILKKIMRLIENTFSKIKYKNKRIERIY